MITINKDQILQPKESIKVLASDWFKISTKRFKNNSIYPKVPLPDYTAAKINSDQSFFRINESYSKKHTNGAPSKFYFWFRLSKKNIYYSESPDSVNVFGSIPFLQIKDVVPSGVFSANPTCFKIIDTGRHDWKICAKDLQTKNSWVCRIKKMVGIPFEDCLKTIMKDSKATVLTKKVTQPIILVPTPSRKCYENWDYQRKGDDWDCDCAEGKEQSPINLPLKKQSVISPIKPVFQYEEVVAKHASISKDGQMKTMENLQIKYVDAVLKISTKSFGKVVTLDGAVYLAQDIIFHTPSEHTINGKRYEMEMQVIHYGQTRGDIAKQVVLSFLFKKKPGVYNKFIDDVDFFNLPSPISKVKNIANNLYIPKIFYSSTEKGAPFFKPFSFYTYEGSLTQPPCTERTIHYVAAKPIPLGSTALQLFQEAIKIPDMVDSNGNVKISTSSPSNYRNTKSLNGRKVFYYSSKKFKGPEPPKRRARPVAGHYEKLKRKFIKYIHVEGEKPSGLPNAFVVSEAEAKGYNN